MAQYTVIVTRDVTESTCIQVEARTPDEAEDAALEALNAGEYTWETDEGSWNSGSPYVTDVSSNECR